jgi:hypothetical protein
MIPKVIHYCWFGGQPKNDTIIECMASWRKLLPDYKIIEWNERNCDITGNTYTKTAYEQGKWAFVADFFRFKILYEKGGIYLDTDMKLHKPLDSFLGCDAFFGIECYQYVNGSIIGSMPSTKVIYYILENYKDDKCDKNNHIIVERITDVLRKHYGLKLTGETQCLSGNITVFSPNILTIDVGDGKCVAEHLYNDSWGINASGGSYRYEVLKRYFTNPYINYSVFGIKALLKRLIILKARTILPDCIYYYLKNKIIKKVGSVKHINLNQGKITGNDIYE